MSDLIPNVPWTEFVKIAKAGRLKELKACEVTFNGEYLFTAIIPHGDMFTFDYARTQADFLGNKANIVGGRESDEILKEPVHVAA